MADFFSMGGYAFFVWTSYGLALVLMLLNWFLPVLKERDLLQKIARRNRKRGEA